MIHQVFVAEDEARAREGIRLHLESTGRFQLCGEAADGEMALPAIMELKPDILITDIKMPFMDGLALAREVKRARPRTKIIIISGHDEFEYAKQAISIGVDEYLLKPFDAEGLLETLDKAGDAIEGEHSDTNLSRRERYLRRQEILHLRDGFFDELLTGVLSASDALQKAEEFRIDLPARHYLAAQTDLGYARAIPDAPLQIRAVIDAFLGERADVLWCLRGRDRLVLIAKGDSTQAVENTIYEILISLHDELRQMLGVTASSCIGTPAERITGIAGSYNDAQLLCRRVPNIPDGAILDFSDIEDSALPQGASDELTAQRLRYLTAEDVPRILGLIFGDGGGGSDVGSMIFSHNRLADLAAASQVVGESGGDPAAVFPELGVKALLRASGPGELRGMAEDVLRRLIEYKDRVPGSLKYAEAITRAKQFIHEHYADSSLSLNTVAANTGFSPNHFSTIFSQNTKETFIGYLTRVRMERARALLAQTVRPTQEIAFQVGYNDSNYFRYLFKKHFGMSPRDYRQSLADKAGAPAP